MLAPRVHSTTRAPAGPRTPTVDGPAPSIRDHLGEELSGMQAPGPGAIHP